MTDDDFAFPAEVEDIAAVPGELRPLYEAAHGGGYSLKPNVAKLRDNPGLKGALDKERIGHKTQTKKAKALEDFVSQLAQTLEVADPSEIPTRIEELRGRASPQANDAVRAEIEGRFKQTYAAQLEQERREKEKLRKALTETLVDREVQSAIGAARGNLKTLFPHVKQSVQLIEEEGRLVPRVLDASGSVRYRDDGMPMTAADFVSELRRDADFAPNFEGTGNTGSGARGAGGSGAGAGKSQKAYSLEEWRGVVARAKPDERTQLLKDLNAGRVVVRR